MEQLPDALLDFVAVHSVGDVLVILRPRGRVHPDELRWLRDEIDGLDLPAQIRFVVVNHCDVMVVHSEAAITGQLTRHTAAEEG